MIRREIVLPSPREEVWEALTEPERLADWFDNDVDLDLRPGGGASFRWSNGEERTATATELTGELPMTRQAVAKHLATLADAGLVESERQGRETRYRLTEAGEEWDDRLDALRRHLGRRA